MRRKGIEVLIDQTITKVEQEGNERIFFHTREGTLHMHHYQDCCESVWLEDVVGGTLEDLEYEKVLDAWEMTHSSENSYESQTWTFYTIRTMNHTITLRWCGESNGYYSEEVDCEWSEKE